MEAYARSGSTSNRVSVTGVPLRHAYSTPIFFTAVLNVALAFCRLGLDIVEDMMKVQSCHTGAGGKDVI